MSGLAVRYLAHSFLFLFPWLRDRMRCPRCGAVGTWKPHGGFLDFEDTRGVRRWLCKWCGLYRGPEGEKQARAVEGLWWMLDDDERWVGGTTPAELCSGYWPWRG